MSTSFAPIWTTRGVDTSDPEIGSGLLEGTVNDNDGVDILIVFASDTVPGEGPWVLGIPNSVSVDLWGLNPNGVVNASSPDSEQVYPALGLLDRMNGQITIAANEDNVEWSGAHPFIWGPGCVLTLKYIPR